MTTTPNQPSTDFDSPELVEWTERMAQIVKRYAVGTDVIHMRSGQRARVIELTTCEHDLEPVFTVEYTGGWLFGRTARYHADEIGDHFTPSWTYAGLPSVRTGRGSHR